MKLTIAALIFLAGYSLREYREWLETETADSAPVITREFMSPDELSFLDDLDQHWLDLEALEYLLEG